MYEKKRYICIDKVNSCGNSRVYESKCDYDKAFKILSLELKIAKFQVGQR